MLRYKQYTTGWQFKFNKVSQATKVCKKQNTMLGSIDSYKDQIQSVRVRMYYDDFHPMISGLKHTIS